MRYALILTMAAGAWAQQLDLSVLARLESKAQERAVVDLDPEKIRMASQFLSDKDKKNAIGVLNGIRAISVRTFEFAGRGEYGQADLDPIRNQMKAPNWSRIVDVREKDESSEIWLHTEAGKLTGITVIAAEPTELSVVNIVGPVDLNALASLPGVLGIPNIQSQLGGKRRTAPGKDD